MVRPSTLRRSWTRFGTAALALTLLMVGCTDSSTGVPFQMGHNTGSISGTVTVGGTALGGIELESASVKVTTDASGHYAFAKVSAGTRTVRIVRAPSWVTFAALNGSVTVYPGGKATLDFTAPLAKTSGVRVSISTGSRSVSGASTGLVGPLDATMPGVRPLFSLSGTTDGSGAFVFNTLAAGTYEVRVRTNDAYLLLTDSVRQVTVGANAVASLSFVVTELPRPAPMPTNLVLVADSVGVRIAWQSERAADKTFHVDRQVAGTGAWSEIATTDGLDMLDGQVKQGTRYAYRVKACSPGGCSSPTPAKEILFPVTLPAPATNLTVTVESPISAKVSWSDNSTNETFFRVMRRVAGGTWSFRGDVGADITQQIDGTLQPATTYGYTVAACNTVGCSTPTAEVQVTTPDQVPSAPTGLTATATSSSQINVTWTDNSSNETSFKVERRQGAGTWSVATSTGAGVTTWSNTGLSASTTYSYRVSACSSLGCSPPSSEATATTPTASGDPTVPASPSGLTATGVSDSRIDLTWSDNSSNETRFKIEWRQGTGAWTATHIDKDLMSFPIMGLAPSTTYTFRVSACNALGCSAPSSEATATTQAAPTAPAPPSGLVATAMSASAITLTWSDNSSSETGFKVERRQGVGAWAVAKTTGADVTTWSNTGLSANTAYTYRVSACNALGCSATSSESSATTLTVSGDVDLMIDGIQVIQSVQTYPMSVALVAGRAALLRVFVVADRAWSGTPAVRVRGYVGASTVFDQTISGPGGQVPTSADQGTLSSSWNVTLPASAVQAGLQIEATVDPNGQVAEVSESNNASTSSVTVQSVASFDVTLIPIKTSFNGKTGKVSNQLLNSVTAMFPIKDATVQTHAVVTTTVVGLDAPGYWSQITGEMDALRTAEGSSRYYYGVVDAYGSGNSVVGMGFVGHPVAIGIDFMPGAMDVAAHEWGHNFGSQHAPCGAVAGPDPNFPYAGGVTGAWGYDGSSLLDPTTHHDIMGYCNMKWISDYTFNNALGTRASAAASRVSAMVARSPSLLVWGRMTDAGLVLEPAFEVETEAAMPEGGGAYRLDLLDAAGRVLKTLRFAGIEVGDADDGARHFSFAIPLASFASDRLARIRLSGGGHAPVERTQSVATMDAPVITQTGGRTVLAWDAIVSPAVLVRDPTTGQVLGIGRGGRMELGMTVRSLDVRVSDGVRTRRVEVRR